MNTYVVGFENNMGERAPGSALVASMDGVPRCLVAAGMHRVEVEVACTSQVL